MKLFSQICAIIITSASMMWLSLADSIDRPCLARSVANRSVLCVCTAAYCDTVTRQRPVTGQYVSYMSSEAGLRFAKSTSYLRRHKKGRAIHATIELDPSVTHQTITGFGGAITDATGINWKNLSDPRLMQNLIESYCGDSGIQYNMLRVPIGGTDFSTHGYAYNELPVADVALNNFTLAYEDYEYKIPMIKACMKAASADVYVVSATWSPPGWMKTNNALTGFSRLKKEYFQTYADYHYKFIKKYAEQGIPVWGISTTNEPIDGSVQFININDLGWSIELMGEWIESNLGPTLRNSRFKDTNILANDDQRPSIILFWNKLVSKYPGTLKYLDGVAVHWYANKITPASILTQAMADYPDKFVLSTEACTGVLSPVPVDFGSWSRAEEYVKDIIENLTHNVIGWIDWNMCLNSKGGPNWTGSPVDSPIIVNPEAGEFYKQPMFYAMGHFSKFVLRGSQRIKSSMTSDINIQSVAFRTPDKTVVVVIYNSGNKRTVRIALGGQQAELEVEAKSFTTVEMLNE